MKMKRVVLLVVVVLLGVVGAPASLHSQTPTPNREQIRVVDTTRVQVLTMRGGTSLIGRITAVRGDSVDFVTGIGRVSVAIADIREIRETDAGRMHNGQYWPPNPNATRLFFAPTGQMIKKGEGYFSDYEIFFPGVAYGVTDNLTIGGGVSLFPAGVDEQLYYVTPKIGRSFGEQLHAAAGLLLVGSQGETGGIGYGVGTLGDGDRSVTLGLGYGFAGGEVESKPLVMLGGEKRVSRRIAVVSENYILPIEDDNVVYSLGIRFIGEKITTDLALVNVVGSGIIGVPYVDFVFKF